MGGKGNGKGNLAVDFISILPFWALTLDYGDPLDQRSDAEQLEDKSSLTHGSVMFRLIKLARMLKALESCNLKVVTCDLCDFCLVPCDL